MNCIYYNGGYCSLSKNLDGINMTCNEQAGCPDRRWNGYEVDWESLKVQKGRTDK